MVGFSYSLSEDECFYSVSRLQKVSRESDLRCAAKSSCVLSINESKTRTLPYLDPIKE